MKDESEYKLTSTSFTCTKYLFISLCSFQAPSRRGIKHFKLANVTSTLDRQELDDMSSMAFNRVLQAESKLVLYLE